MIDIVPKRRANLHEICFPEKSNPDNFNNFASNSISKMMKRFLLLSVVLFSLNSSRAQFDTAFAKTSIIRCTDSLTHAFKTKDWELFTLYSNPALVARMGGKKEFIDYLSQLFMNVPDTAWKQYEAGKILQIVKTPADLQAIIELKSTLEWQGTRIISTSHMIGQSWDGGLFWTFFDSLNDANNARQIKPDLSEELIIPQKNEKVENETSAPKQKNKK